MIKIFGGLLLAVGGLLGLGDQELLRESEIVPELPQIEEFKQTDAPPENTQKTAQSEAIVPQTEQGGVDEPKTPPIEEDSTKTAIVEAETRKHGKQEPFSCITWARAHSKVGQPPRVDFARNLLVTHFQPRVGSWIIFGGNGIFGKAGHTGIVDFVNPNNELVTFSGFNYPYGKQQTMTINIDDPKFDILGYWDNRQD